jgi:hypothetical protein
MDGIHHDGALGELDHQQLRGNLVAGEQLADLAGELEVEEAPGGHVDRDRELVAGVAPLAALAQGLVEHVVGQGGDEPGPFGQGDELIRRDQTMFGVLPAHQRLHPEDLPGVGADLGLVVQQQLLLLQGPAQLAEQGEAPGAVLVLFGVEQREPGMGLLGGVHGDVGPLQRLLTRQQHRELIAPQARDGVDLPERGLESLADLDQQLVAVVVAEGVVDLLEPVQVDQQQRGGNQFPVGLADGLAGAVV